MDLSFLIYKIGISLQNKRKPSTTVSGIKATRSEPGVVSDVLCFLIEVGGG